MLDPILEDTRERIARMAPVAEYRARAEAAPPVKDFVAALSAPGLGVIAEKEVEVVDL